eukprot:g34671.t1
MNLANGWRAMGMLYGHRRNSVECRDYPSGFPYAIFHETESVSVKDEIRVLQSLIHRLVIVLEFLLDSSTIMVISFPICRL